jgi:peptide/nickel transport system permease protein
VLWAFPSLLVVYTLTFVLMHSTPGGPWDESEKPLPANIIANLNRQYHIDDPLWKQYVVYLWNALHLDFGYSIAEYPARVLPMIMRALPWTIGLLVVATLLAFAAGTLLGALIAWPKAPRAFRYLMGPMMALSSIPYYLLGLVLVYFLGVVLPLFPLSGGYSIGTIPRLNLPSILDILHHAALPALAIVLVGIGFWSLGMRGMMITTAGEDYMNFAEAKGLLGRRIFLRYAVRNAILPQVTSLAINLGTVVSGSVVVEVVFGYPGIGSLLFKAINGLDYFVIYGIVFMTVLAISLTTLLIDLLYPVLDPRIGRS